MNHDHDQDNSSGQSGINPETEQRNRENESGQQSPTPNSEPRQSDQSQSGQAQAGQSGDEGGSGFVGSGDDQSSDYLTAGANEDFQPEGEGASDTNAGTSDIETGQSQSPDATLDDGSDTSR